MNDWSETGVTQMCHHQYQYYAVLSQDGGVYVFPSEEEALAYAKKLAKSNPGKSCRWVKVIGEVALPTQEPKVTVFLSKN